MRLARLLPLLLLLMVISSRPAYADATVFLGSITTPSAHTAKGFAFGVGILIVGVEFEYASSGEDLGEEIPSLRTGMGNVYVQTPFPIAGFQPYATTGVGGYREELGTVHQETNFGFNTGGGVKYSLIGPLKARFDYRAFKLGGSPLHSVVHRVYAGVTLGF